MEARQLKYKGTRLCISSKLVLCKKIKQTKLKSLVSMPGKTLIKIEKKVTKTFFSSINDMYEHGVNCLT